MWVSVFLRSQSVWVSVCMKWNKLAHRQPLFQVLCTCEPQSALPVPISAGSTCLLPPEGTTLHP